MKYSFKAVLILVCINIHTIKTASFFSCYKKKNASVIFIHNRSSDAVNIYYQEKSDTKNKRLDISPGETVPFVVPWNLQKPTDVHLLFIVPTVTAGNRIVLIHSNHKPNKITISDPCTIDLS